MNMYVSGQYNRHGSAVANTGRIQKRDFAFEVWWERLTSGVSIKVLTYLLNKQLVQ